MNIEDAREYCLSLPGVTEDMPYGPDWVVFRIEGKIIMHIWLEAPVSTIAIKLPPALGEELRDRYNGVTAAYHLNKVHWNDIFIEDFPDDMVKEWINTSYKLVISHLPLKLRTKYE